MIYKKLHISLIFSNLVKSKPLSTNPRMCNLYTKFVKILEICKQFSHNLVNERGKYTPSWSHARIFRFGGRCLVLVSGIPTLRNINQNLRNTKFPYDNWRTADPGHIHYK